MENKLNLLAVENYSKAFCEQLLDKLYAESSSINGNDLLNLPIKQVGLFVLHQINDSWAKESQKLRSPYFDYEEQAVKEALSRLMNVLSKQISISRKSLKPILEKATTDTIVLFFSPYHYYSGLVQSLLKGDIDKEGLEKLKKFINVNVGAFDSLINYLEDEEYDSTIGLEQIIDRIFTGLEPPTAVEELAEQFSSVLALSPDQFFQTEVVTASEANNYEGEQPVTINDSFANEENISLAEALSEQQPAGSIKTLLTINQKFMFINDLFDGNQDDFSKVLDFLDDCKTKEAAISFIDSNYIKRNIWRQDAPQVKDFISLINRKYA